MTDNAEIADTFFSRFRGLMFRKSVNDNYALYITPCNQIHMLNMKFAIDVIYTDKSDKVIRIDADVQPWKICKTVRQAENVIELKSFSAEKFNIRPGDIITIVRD